MSANKAPKKITPQTEFHDGEEDFDFDCEDRDFVEEFYYAGNRGYGFFNTAPASSICLDSFRKNSEETGYAINASGAVALYMQGNRISCAGVKYGMPASTSNTERMLGASGLVVNNKLFWFNCKSYRNQIAEPLFEILGYKLENAKWHYVKLSELSRRERRQADIYFTLAKIVQVIKDLVTTASKCSQQVLAKLDDSFEEVDGMADVFFNSACILVEHLLAYAFLKLVDIDTSHKGRYAEKLNVLMASVSSKAKN